MTMRQRLTKTPFANYFTLLFFLGLFLTPSVLTAQVQGKVYRDFNANGVFDSTATFKEIGLSGITITAYNAAGTSVGITTSNATGNYTITGVTGAVRVEFTGLATGDFSGPKGASSGTSVQFVTAPITSVNYGVNYPSDYCGTTNPKLATPCYINGDPAGGGTAGTSDVFIGFPFNATANDAPTNEYAIGSQTGSTWGVAYQRSTKTLFTSAFLKRHVGLGTLGIGGIYKVDGRSVSPASVSFVDVKTIGIDVGTVSSNVIRGLLADKDLPSNDDPLVFDQIGKVGMGDMDITDDEKKLFLTNLKDRKLYSIIIDSDNNSATAPTAADVQSFTIPNPNCTNGVARPFGIKIYKGKVYVGVVCTAENVGGTVNNMFAYIYALDLVTGLFNATPVYSFPLNYTKLTVEAADGGGWQPWTADYTQFAFTNEGSNDRVIRPQPMLADIAFDVDGSMVVIFMDRTGHQYGFRNYSPDVADTKLYNAEIGGDILRIANVNGVFQLEHNGTAGSLTGANVGNSGGPGTLSGNNYTAPSGEFYDDMTVAGTHNDITQGGAALVSGIGQIAVCSMDPIQYTSGGIVTWSNTTGQQVNGYELYASNSNVATFGKANGLGDLEALCNPTPIEIGNRVWIDTDKDGIQDANELGVDGVTVKLKLNGTTLATTTTANGGQYYFTNVLADTTYTIVIETFATQTPLSNLTLTTANVGSNGSDLIDNDAVISTTSAIITYRTGLAGQNNHSLDFGFVCTPPTSTGITATQATCTGATANSDAAVTVTGISGMTKYSYGTNGTTGFFYSTATASTATSISKTGLANPATATTYTFRIYGSDSTCYKDTSVVLNPKTCSVACTAPTGGTVTEIQATCNGVIANNDASFSITGIVGGDKYAYNTSGGTGLDYATATSFSGGTITITGLPNPSVSTTYTIRVFNLANDCHVDFTATIDPKTCVAPCPQITLGPVPLPGGAVGQPYTAQVTATGGVAPYEFYWYPGTTGSLPDGLSMDVSGLVTGVPTSAGSYAVKIICLDVNSCPDTLDPAAITIQCTYPTIGNITADTATCTSGVANNDAVISLTGIVDGAAYSYGTNGTTGLVAATATTLSGSSINLTGLSNPITATTYTFRIYSIDTTCYNDTTVVLNPSVCPPPCSITATFTQNPCNNNGTTAITTDDYFTVTVSGVSSTNGGISGKYEVLYNGTVLNVGGTTYGTPVTVGGILDFKSDGATTYNLTVRDADVQTCATPVFTTVISNSCSVIGCKPVVCLPVTVTKF